MYEENELRERDAKETRRKSLAVYIAKLVHANFEYS